MADQKTIPFPGERGTSAHRLPDPENERKENCLREIRKQLHTQRERYRLMHEEDVVKFVFQGMLGVGHLINSFENARDRLTEEMESLLPEYDGLLIEKISTEWARVNLRPAKARGITGDTLARLLVRSADQIPLPFARQDVYDFCLELDSSDEMKAAAEKILNENWLPNHSRQYREAYRPAYRVLHTEFLFFTEDGE